MGEIETIEAEKMGWLDLGTPWHILPHFPLLRIYLKKEPYKYS